MSSHYINLFCPFPDCTASESIYTGDVYLNDFPDTGPDSFEGESISTPCNEHAGMDLPAADQTPATDSERVQWGWCDDTDADPEPRNVKVCASREEALDAIDVPPFDRLLLRGTTKTVWEEA